MLRILNRAKGRIRLARGRCPACDSGQPESCPVCLGHHGPFPTDEGTLRRWAHRFETGHHAHPANVPTPTGIWSAARSARTSPTP
jgi:hypothetical protein